jgi:glutathione synthase/RimK-type ligase-like ATP-grasp enzyme
MNKYIIITDKHSLIEPVENQIVLKAQDFINKKYNLSQRNSNVKVINLSSNYEYLSQGYYISLLCEARGIQCFPNLENIVSLSWQRNHTHHFSELNAVLEKHYNLPFEDPYIRKYTSFFGRHENPKLEPLTRRIFDLFRAPVFSFEIRYTEKQKWNIIRIEAESPNKLFGKQIEIFNKDLRHFTGTVWRKPSKKKQERYWIAVLHDPKEKNPPSNAAALKKFIEAGKKMDVWVELITKTDFSSILEYDALFIRETTAINNHTIRFARKAEFEGIPTIDDANSIIKCCNKIYLNELLDIHKIDRPASLILSRKDLENDIRNVRYPCVIKIPDGSFSSGVFKINTPKELSEKLTELFKKSELILCQEFLPSAFDWRIGVLDNKPLFASKYYMAKGHWQIYNHSAEKKKLKEGDGISVPLDEVPPKVLDTALRTCKYIGNGLYGADIKELEDGRVVVIEVNDNPNIDKGVEDKVLGDALYSTIIQSFINRIESK